MSDNPVLTREQGSQSHARPYIATEVSEWVDEFLQRLK